MAVMGKMREYTKVFLVLLVFAFVGTIVFDWGMDLTGLRTSAGTIAKVNGKNISVSTFYDAYQQEIENLRQRSGNEPSESQLDFLRDQVYENLVREELVTQEIQKRGLQATEGEIVHYIFDAPPGIVKQDPTFQNEQGQFDYGKYQAALKNPGADWRPLEEYLRRWLPYQKFNDMFSASVIVTESQVRDEYLKRNQNATVQYVQFPAEKYRQQAVTVEAAEIAKYYQEHPEEFKEPEKRKIDYVIFATQPTSKDSQTVRDLALDLKDRLLSGADFAELARTYSEDESNRERGGDLSFFKRGAMVKPFEEAAFAAQVGEVVGPVQTNFGLHLIKVLEKKVEGGEESVHASHILLKFKASAETTTAARDSADYFSAQARETSWEETVKSEKVKPQTTTFFVEGTGFVPGLGVNRGASRFIFKNNVGSVSETLETPQGYLVLRVAEVQKEHVRPLEEVKSQIETKLQSEKQKQLAHQAAEKFYAELMQSGATALADLAARDSLSVQTAEPFNRAGFVPGIGRDQDFIGAAFSLKPGQISKPAKGLRGSYILQLVNLDTFDAADYASKKDAVRQQLLERAKQEAFNQWYADLKEKASIKDYRDQYF